MEVISSHPSVGPFVGVTRDKTVDFGPGKKFRIVVYGAYNACGLIGPERNGIAILNEDRRDVVTSDIEPITTGYFGPSQRQIDAWEKICKMKWKTFRAFCNESPNARYEI